MQETWVQSLGREDPLEKEMATHSSILAWRIPWTKESGRLQSMVFQESDTIWWLNHHHQIEKISVIYQAERASISHNLSSFFPLFLPLLPIKKPDMVMLSWTYHLVHFSNTCEGASFPTSALTCVLSHVWLCNPMDCGLLGSSVHGIFQKRILEWVTGFFSKESSWSRDWTCVSCIGRQVPYHWAAGEALL